MCQRAAPSQPAAARQELLQMDEDVLHRYGRGAELIRHAVAGLSRNEMLAHPVPGTWSIQQIVVHLLESDLIATHRMKRVIAEDNPSLTAYDESRFAKVLFYDAEPIDEILTMFALNRAQMLRILRRLPDAAFRRIGTHNQRGELTLTQMVQDYVDHVDHHLQFVFKKRVLLHNPAPGHATTPAVS
jgi:uncharacterized damage-inducible protein DinB